MGRKAVSIDLERLSELRAEGKSLYEISEIMGVNYSTLFLSAKRSGFSWGPKKNGKMKKEIPIDEVIEEYEKGTSVLAMSKLFGVSRFIIKDRLLSYGYDIRNQRDALILRHEKSTPEERRLLAHEAHRASSRRYISDREKEQRAQKRAFNCGLGETEIIHALDAIEITAEQQWPCGSYCIDVAIGPIAVELMNRSTPKMKGDKFHKRAQYLRECGYCVIVITFRYIEEINEKIEEITRFLRSVYRTKNLREKDWHIKCWTEYSKHERNEFGQFTNEIKAIDFHCSINEWDHSDIE